jgi:hypothetical protein
MSGSLPKEFPPLFENYASGHKINSRMNSFSFVEDMPDSDESVVESSEEFLSEGVPDEGSASSSLGFSGLGGSAFFSDGVNGKVQDGFFGVRSEVPSFNSAIGGGGDPLQFGVELDLVDHRSGFNGSDGFSEVTDVPDVEGLVSSSGGKIFAVGGDGDGVDGSIVGFEGRSDLEVDVPDLESSVPTD